MGEISQVISFTILAGTASGPEAFPTFKFRSLKTPSDEMFIFGIARIRLWPLLKSMSSLPWGRQTDIYNSGYLPWLRNQTTLYQHLLMEPDSVE